MIVRINSSIAAAQWQAWRGQELQRRTVTIIMPIIVFQMVPACQSIWVRMRYQQSC